MTITEKQRHDLHSWLEEQMGQDRAATLMGYLPPVGWADVATKRDLDHLETTLRSEISQLRGEFGQLRADVRGELVELRADIQVEIAKLHRELSRQNRNLAITFATLMVAFCSALLAIVRLG
ncbi:hypothetical protein BH20ACT2_BH20ACT2_05730 [soil metagenome]